MAGKPAVLLLPGLGGSGPDHWQAIWADRDPAAHIVEQEDWDRPDLDVWQDRLKKAVADLDGTRFVFVAHSLGCALAVHWALRVDLPRPRAMMLVAPADVDSPAHTPDAVRGFAPMPVGNLPCRSAVVASADDPYVGLTRAADFAGGWGAVFHPVGAFGHINGDAGLGDWPEGRGILDRLIADAG